MAFFHADIIFSLFSEQIKEDVLSSCAKNLKKSEMREKKVELVGAKKSLSLYGAPFHMPVFLTSNISIENFAGKPLLFPTKMKSGTSIVNARCRPLSKMSNFTFRRKTTFSCLR